jgi:hypothetical protein
MIKIRNLIILVCMLSVANAWGASFLDDFNRADGGVGNDWTIQTDGTITVQIVDNELLIAGTQATDWARCGVSRSVEDATMVSCDFKVGDNFNFHVRIDDPSTGAFLEVYTWGGPLIQANSPDGSWPGWVDIVGSEIVADAYNNIMLERVGTDVIVTLNGTAVATLPNENLLSIGGVQIASDAAAGTTGSIHVDNVAVEEQGQEPTPEPVDLEVGYVLRPPVIDGEVDYVWEGASEVYFVPLEDAADGSGTWKVLYDEENLYVMVDITDDSLQNDSASAWQDDSVEIYFDGGNTKLTTPLSGDDHQYTFGWTADDIQGTNIDGYTEGIEQAQVTTDTGWRIEVKMPWLTIWGVTPQAGDLIGIDCYYNDDDDGGDSREGKMLSFSPIEGWNDASQWGTAILANIPEPVDPGTEGMIAYYAFENDANDSSVNGLNGVIMGDPVFAEGPAGYGMALDFDGDGDYVDCGNDAMFSVTDALTVSVWINWRAPGAQWQTIIAKGDNAWRLARNSDSQGMDFGFDDGSRGWISASTASDVPLNEWHQLTATYDTIDGAKIYLDGVLEGTNADTTGITTGDYPVFIGDNSQQTGRYWDGLIDEVMIYSRALSNGEILYLAGERAEAGDPSLSIYYTFDEVSDVVADQSGNGLDGVVVGDVTADAEGMLVGAAKFANAGYLDLDGANVPAEDIPTTGMTLAAWIKCEDTGDHHAIFNARASDETWVVHPEARSDGTFRWLLRSYGGTTMFDIRAGVVTWGEWEHFAGTYDEASAKATLTINGEVVSEMDVASPADIAGDWGMGARVGKNIDDARPFTGLMDEFRLFTRALSQDEIVDMMAGM